VAPPTNSSPPPNNSRMPTMISMALGNRGIGGACSRLVVVILYGHPPSGLSPGLATYPHQKV
jgi:hypothetical protein